MKPAAERGRSPEHVKALEAFDQAEKRLAGFVNYEVMVNGYSDERLATMPEYQALVADRDDAREAARVADPKVSV